jgi:hypothetical protein
MTQPLRMYSSYCKTARFMLFINANLLWRGILHMICVFKQTVYLLLHHFTMNAFFYRFHCRWQWSKQKFTYGQLQTVMEKHTMYEGTDYDLSDKGQLHEVSNEA